MPAREYHTEDLFLFTESAPELLPGAFVDEESLLV